MKLKAAKIKETGTLVVTLQGHPSLYAIDGEVCSTSKVMVAPNQKLMYKPQDMRTIDSYSDGNVNLSQFDYRMELNRLESKSVDSDDDELTFANIEDEVAYHRFIKAFKPVYGMKTFDYEPVEVDIVEVRLDTNSEYIVPIWAASNTIDEMRLYEFYQAEYAYNKFRTYAATLGLEFEFSNGFEYLKVEGKYAKDLAPLRLHKVVGSFESIQAPKKYIDDTIEKFLNIELAKKNNSIVPDLRSVLDMVNSTIAKVRGLDVKKSSENTQSNIVKSLKDYAAELTKGL